jgi:hypothetical protein
MECKAYCSSLCVPVCPQVRLWAQSGGPRRTPAPAVLDPVQAAVRAAQVALHQWQWGGRGGGYVQRLGSQGSRPGSMSDDSLTSQAQNAASGQHATGAVPMDMGDGLQQVRACSMAEGCGGCGGGAGADEEDAWPSYTCTVHIATSVGQTIGHYTFHTCMYMYDVICDDGL